MFAGDSAYVCSYWQHRADEQVEMLLEVGKVARDDGSDWEMS